MELCLHCHYYKPSSHFYKRDNSSLNYSIYNNFNKTKYRINCTNHKIESERGYDFVWRCPCYKTFKTTHEYPKTGQDEKIKYKELQKLIQSCPRSKLSLNHAIIKSTKNFKPIIPITETTLEISPLVEEKAFENFHI